MASQAKRLIAKFHLFWNDVSLFNLGVAKEFEMVDSAPLIIVEDNFEDDFDWREGKEWEDIYNEDTVWQNALSRGRDYHIWMWWRVWLMIYDKTQSEAMF